LKNNYNVLLDIIENLVKDKESLTKKDVVKVIDDLQELLKNQTYRSAYGISEDSICEEDKETLIKDIETKFNIQMDKCVLLQGLEQQLKDNSWWTNKKNSIGDENNFSYWDSYQRTLTFPPKVKRVIDVDTDCIMNNLFNPDTKDDSDYRYGMVMGHVQSGKTSNYAGLICKAIDAGYKFFIIIAGIHNNLRNQTQLRIQEVFENIPKSKSPVFLTMTDVDFKNNDVQKFSSLHFETTTNPFFLIIKKNTSVLDAVIKWVEQENNTVPMLLIDDEADNATINTKDENDPTAVNKKIRTLLKKFRKYSYIGYTATPFANIFINHQANNETEGQDLFPKDFIIALKTPSNYQGAQKLFLDEYDPNIMVIDSLENMYDISEFYEVKGLEADCKFPIPRNHKKDFEPTALPESLELAIRMFFLNIAVRNLRRQNDKHNSMLIHATRFTGVHSSIAQLVNEYVDNIRKGIKIYGKISNNNFGIVNELKQTFEEYYNVEFVWTDVLEELNIIYDKVEVLESHCSSKQTIEYPKNGPQKNIIAVGGNSLARGFTLEGLNISYFLRNAGASDTLMQMARWFGYRPNYEDICKVFLPSDIRDKFESVADSSDELYKMVNEMPKNKTPEDFGLRVKAHPDSFLITARNKMKEAKPYQTQVGLDGYTKETSWISSKQDDISSNIAVISEFLEKLRHNCKVIERPHVNKFLWLDVDTSLIKEFTNKFHFVESYEHLPIDCIKKYIEDYSNDKWRVALIGVENSDKINIADFSVGLQSRQVTIPDNDEYYELGVNRQMTVGLVEKWALTEVEFLNLKDELNGEKPKRKDIRSKMQHPALMIHLIKPKNEKISDKILPALSYTFPSITGIREPKTITYMVNSVYLKNLAELEAKRKSEEEETDDD